MTIARKYADQALTLSEYLSLPENDRMELVEGLPYLLASPSDSHQRIAGGFYAALRAYLRGKGCQVRIAPLDVFLDEQDDQPTVVQPDVFVVCDRSKLDHRGCHGAPDLIIEVLSPGTKGHDQVVKLNLYRRCGVREYWIVDAEGEPTVHQFVLSDQGYLLAGAYGANDRLRVHVLDSCEVDLHDVFFEE